MQQYPHAQTAQGLASLGRGEDSMLMHITPDEFNDFNRMAQSAGFEHIPINPQTGLPEYGFGKAFKGISRAVKSVTKGIAKVLQSPLVAPLVGIAGTAFGIPPWLTGVITGGITTLGTGDLGAGIMTGLGAYGGANLGSTFAKQGVNSGIGSLANAGSETARNIAQYGPLTATETGALASTGGSGFLGMNSLGEAGNVFSDMGAGVGDFFNNPAGIGQGFDNFRAAMGTTPTGPSQGFVQDPATGNFVEQFAAVDPALAGVVQPASVWSAGSSLAAPLVGPALSLAGDLAGPIGDEPLDDAAAAASKPYEYSPLRLYGPEYAKVYGGDEYSPLVLAKSGGLMQLNQGGYLNGGNVGDGMSDDIPASIENKQPAALSDGEFVIPADVVSHLGNGSSNAGSRRLYDMMAKIRKDRTGNSEQGKQINPMNYMMA